MFGLLRDLIRDKGKLEKGTNKILQNPTFLTPHPEGSYFYVIDGIFENGKSFSEKGSVRLLMPK